MLDGTGSWQANRRQRSIKCSRKSSTDQLHLGVAKERHSGCSCMDGIEPERSMEMELFRRAETVTWLKL